MIVKNEQLVIERCLNSVKDHISYWVIVDTGSEDDTIAVVEHSLKDIPGELISRPWVDFSHNRNEAIQYAKGKSDYLLIIDADEELRFDNGFIWPELVSDCYDIKTIYNGIVYYRTQLLANRLPWEWRGVLHEYVACAAANTKTVLENVSNIPHPDGARSRDVNKYLADANLLETALQHEPENNRYLFYLAQSYRDADLGEKAVVAYQRRVERGGWDQETWFSLYQIACIQQKLGKPWSIVLNAYLEAYQYRSQRSEPLYHIIRYYRMNKQYHSAYLFSKTAKDIPYPSDSLFIEKAIYDYLLSMEHAICCYWVGDHHEAIKVNNTILECEDLPESIYDQVIKNRQFSLDFFR